MTLTESILIKLANSLPNEFKKTLIDCNNKKLFSFFLVVKGNKCKEICSIPVSIEYWDLVKCEEIDKEPINNYRELTISEKYERILL